MISMFYKDQTEKLKAISAFLDFVLNITKLTVKLSTK